MADIDVERKSSFPWLWIILGLILLALIIWWVIPGDEEPVAVTPAPVVDEIQPLPPAADPPTPVAQLPGIPVSQIIESPATWTGRTIGGEVRVPEVPTDRGFWIEDQGERLFVILGDRPREVPIDINPGQILRIREAVVYGADQLGNIPGQIDADTRRIAEAQPVILFADEENIEILQPGTPQ